MTRLLDLSQEFSIRTQGYVNYPSPKIYYIKHLISHGVVAQMVETTMHTGTHLDGPLHFVSNGRDIASIPLDRLYGPGVVVDISDEVGAYEIYKPEHITKKVEVRKGDILIIHTGYHHYSAESPEANELRYFIEQPGPAREFAEWALEMELRWMGVDAPSMDHPMNGPFRYLQPDHAKKCEDVIGMTLDQAFPPEDKNIIHFKLFRHELQHVENIGGEIDKVLNQRVAAIGAFPFKFVGGESALCRVVAFLGN
jgi:kynurenine formamidase